MTEASRLGGRPGQLRAELSRGLRAWPVSSWRHGRRQEVARAAVQSLADLAADAEGQPRRAVPDVGVTGLPDQLAVLAADARAAGVPDPAVSEVLDQLAAELGLRRHAY